jgi:hypothetical protein
MRSLIPVALLLAACGPTANLDLALVRSEAIPTVFTATLDGEASGLDAAWVEYGLGDTYDMVAPLDVTATLPWEVTLLGMKPASEYEARIAVQIDGEVHTGRGHSATTGMVPSGFPDLTLERGEGESFEGFLVAGIVGTATAATMLDEDGAYVWWYQPVDLAQVGRTVLARDGQAMLAIDLNAMGQEDSHMVRIALDGSGTETTSLPWAHHDLFEHEDGTIAYLAHDPMNVDGTEISGDSIVELAPDGTTTVIWSCWDTTDLLPYSGASAGDPPGEWPHANALDYLPDEDAYLVSLLYEDTILRIDRATGAIDWIMGGDHSDFELVGGGTELFERTHQLHRLEDSIVVFVNGDTQGGISRAVEYAVDEQSFEVETLWDYWSDPSMNCISLGDVHRFDSGNTLITYSYSGQIREVTPEGEPTWILSASAGGVIGYVTPVEDLYGE